MQYLFQKVILQMLTLFTDGAGVMQIVTLANNGGFGGHSNTEIKELKIQEIPIESSFLQM